MHNLSKLSTTKQTIHAVHQTESQCSRIQLDTCQTNSIPQSHLWHLFYAAILIGHITGLACLSVCLSRMTWKQTDILKSKLGWTFAKARVTGVPIFSSKDQKSRLLTEVRIVRQMAALYILAACWHWANFFTCHCQIRKLIWYRIYSKHHTSAS